MIASRERGRGGVFQHPVARFLGDAVDGLFVGDGILATDIAIDLVAVGIEIDIRRPSRDLEAAGGFAVFVRIDMDGDDFGVDGLDQVWSAVGLLIQHRAGRAVIAIEVNQDGALLGASQPEGRIHVLHPADRFRRRICHREAGKGDRQESDDSGAQSSEQDPPKIAFDSQHTALNLGGQARSTMPRDVEVT